MYQNSMLPCHCFFLSFSCTIFLLNTKLLICRLHLCPFTYNSNYVESHTYMHAQLHTYTRGIMVKGRINKITNGTAMQRSIHRHTFMQRTVYITIYITRTCRNMNVAANKGKSLPINSFQSCGDLVIATK